MNVQDLGSIGELIAAVATIATLIYLAIQIRQNTAAIRSASIQSANQNIQFSTALVAQSAENADIFQRGLNSFDDLTASEQLQFTTIVMAVFNSADAMYWNHQNGLVPDEIADRDWGVLRFYLRSIGGRRVWETAKDMRSLTPRFIEAVESKVLTQ